MPEQQYLNGRTKIMLKNFVKNWWTEIALYVTWHFSQLARSGPVQDRASRPTDRMTRLAEVSKVTSIVRTTVVSASSALCIPTSGLYGPRCVGEVVRPAQSWTIDHRDADDGNQAKYQPAFVYIETEIQTIGRPTTIWPDRHGRVLGTPCWHHSAMWTRV